MKNKKSNVEDFLKGITHTLKFTSLAGGLEKKIACKFYAWKRKLFRSTVELCLFITGIVFVLLGLVFLLSNFIAIEYVLLGVGTIILYVALLMTKLR